ncbi:immunoglobulin superfamily member 10 [Otolemur garnettii]|uniref:immunoglobulin superfamily member 10 n=1 Tax=Otolemur garnettii TaxID=30611 RepID=UPI000C7F3616|nr:immunoglobulin superfamily member 10 [Otolemur garnettii]
MKVKGRGVSCMLASFAVICVVTTPGSRACPRRCACYVPTEVHCTFRYLTSIPEGLPRDVERINLGYNSLVRLTETDFSGLTKLELLMLHSNSIPAIPDKTFSDLQALQVLKMSYNKVRKLQKDTFYGLRSLTRLHMDHNNIEFINPEAFYGLNFLRLVHLEGNQLTKLHPDTFVSLSYLRIFKTSFIKYLYLSDNFLTSLPQEMISYMPDLESLYLHGNPWTCDCHLKWLSDWIQEKSDIIKCKRDRSPSSPQQCPLCMNPRTSKGKPLAMVPAAAFLCTKPTIDPSLKSKNLSIPEDSSSAFISPQDFLAPFGSITLNMTDQSGNEASMVCSIQKPRRTSPIAFTEENDHILINTSFLTFLVCNIDYGHIQPVWQILAFYSDSPLILERSQLLTETPQLCYKYKQMAPNPEDIFTNIEADLIADPSWLMQDYISLQLNRIATTLSTLQIQYSGHAQVTLPKAEMKPVKHKWTMISRDNNTNLERTVLVGGTIDLNCPGQGDPAPHLEWVLADGSKVRAPYVSEDGRLLIDRSGKLELQMADSFDTGLYHCISTNYEDADILTYRVTVVEPHVEAYHETGVHRTVSIGETLDLPCHATGIPDASISWVLPGNSVLYQSLRGKQILDNGTLRILQVTPKDQGHYRCVAANPSGVDFLIFQVSVKTKEPRPVVHDGETDGSGFDEPKPTAHLTEPPAAPPPVSAPMGAEIRNQVSHTSKKHNYREFMMHQQRGDAVSRRFREHRRQFPPSARKIDPQHWAALLEKAKKNAEPEKQGTTTGRPLPPVIQLLTIPGEEGDSSGMLIPDEEFMVLDNKPSNVPTRTVTVASRTTSDSSVTNTASGTEISPVVGSQIQPPEKRVDFKLSTAVRTTAVLKKINPTVSSKMQDAASQQSSTVFPLLPGATEFQNTDQLAPTREHFQSVSPVTVKTMIDDVNVTRVSSTNNKADVFLESANTTDSLQIPVTGSSQARSNHLNFYTTQKLKNPSLTLATARPHTTKTQSSRNLPTAKELPFPPLHPTPAGFTSRESRTVSSMSMKTTTEAGPPTAPVPVITSESQIARPGSQEVQRTKEPRKNGNKPDISPGQSSGFTTSSAMIPPVLTTADTSIKSNVFAFTLSPLANTNGISSPRGLPSRTLNLTDVTEEPTQVNTPTLRSTVASETLSSRSQESTTAGKMTIGHSTTPPILSSRATVSPVPLSPPFTQSAATDNVAAPTFRTMTNSYPEIAEKGKNPVANMLPTTGWSETTTHASNWDGQKNAKKSGLDEKPVQKVTTSKLLPFDSPSRNIFEKPRIVGGKAASFTVPANSDAFLPCEAVGNPPPTIHWSRVSSVIFENQCFQQAWGKNNRRWQCSMLESTGIENQPVNLRMGSRIHVYPNGSLFIGSVTEKDGGNYLCVARNKMGDDLILMHVSLRLKPAKIDHKQYFKKQVLHGKDFQVDCKASGSPVPEISWSLPDGRMINNAMQADDSGHRTRRYVLFDNGTLYFNKVGIAEEGDYTCYAQNTLGKDEMKVHLTVLTAAPRIRQSSKANSRIKAGDTALLDCEVTGDPKPQIFWLLPSNDMISVSSGRYTFHANGSLSINRVKLLDSGEYVCVARNPSGDDTRMYKLDVVSKPPLINGLYTNKTVIKTTAVRHSKKHFDCRAEGTPSPEVMWVMPDNVFLTAPYYGGRISVYTNGTLEIRNVRLSDSADFVCVARNEGGESVLVVQLEVLEMLRRPTFRNPFNEKIVAQLGKSTALNCSVDGNPPPEMIWILPNGTRFSNGPQPSQYLIASNGSFIIYKTTRDNAGKYRCAARNQVGYIEKLIILEIGQKPVILTHAGGTVRSISGESLSLHCVSDGIPKPSIRWTVPSGYVLDRPHVNGKYILHDNGTLVIKAATAYDRGNYICKAQNSIGQALITIPVMIVAYPPRITSRPPRSILTRTGAAFQLQCLALGVPKPEITWEAPDHSLLSMASQGRKHGHEQLHLQGTLVIQSPQASDSGIYRCTAKNPLGSDHATTYIQVI